MTIKLLHGDCRDVLKTLADASVHCVVTSPPYYALRSYLHAEHPDKHREIGSEPTPEAYLATMVAVFREVRRVLRPDGGCWVNMGDSYSSDSTYNASRSMHTEAGWKQEGRTSNNYSGRTGIPAKNLMMMPARLALALQADGWWLRSMLPWCLSGGTTVYVRCQKGEMPMMIKDMVRLDPATLQLWNGEKWTQVLGWRQNERPDVTYEIELRNGQRIGCTGDHLWPTQRGNVRADQLKDADSLFPSDVIQMCRLPEPPIVKRPSALDDEMVGWFVGLYIAEGSRWENQINIASHTKEDERFAKLRVLCDAFHGEMSLYKKTENSTNVALYGPLIHALIDTYVSGRVASDKHLNVRCWERSDAFLRAVLDGYLSGDGHWDEQNERWRLGFCNNDALVSDLRTMAARLGISVRLRRVMHKLNDQEFPGYRGELRLTQRDRIGGIGRFERKHDGEVVAIRESRARKFWDIAVADEPHLFALASGVLTHNCKRSAMPESVQDRPASAVEYVFLLTRSARYFWDAEAVRRGASENTHTVVAPQGGKKTLTAATTFGVKAYDFTNGYRPSSRNMRNSDLFYDSLEPEPERVPKIQRAAYGARRPDGTLPGKDPHPMGHLGDWAAVRDPATAPLGLICDADGEPLALDVNPAAFSSAHFATFPVKLVEPLIRAGTSEKGCCAACGAPWVRSVAVEYENAGNGNNNMARKGADFAGTGSARPYDVRKLRHATTTGWAAGCACQAAVVPCTVLDCFSGASTTLLVADRLGRDAIGIELNSQYVEMGTARVVDDAPLLAWGAVAEAAE